MTTTLLTKALFSISPFTLRMKPFSLRIQEDQPSLAQTPAEPSGLQAGAARYQRARIARLLGLRRLVVLPLLCSLELMAGVRSKLPMKLGCLVIGQSPRPDLTAPIEEAFPECEILVKGALDGIPKQAIPNVDNDDLGSAIYPLITRLRDGTKVRAEEHELEPLLQEKLEDLERSGVNATVLLCAGSFESVMGSKPLLKPYTCAVAAVRSLHVRSLGVLCPVGQEKAIRKHWLDSAAGATRVETVTMDMEPAGGIGVQELEALAKQIIAWKGGKEGAAVQCIVIDYVGQTALGLASLRILVEKCGLPVIDMQELALNMLRSLLPVPDTDEDAAMDSSGAEGDSSAVQVLESGSWKGEGAQYHHMHDKMLAAALCDFFAKEQAAGGGSVSVIDLGCGMGEYVKQFRAAGIHANGVDGNPDTVALTQGRCGVADLSRPIPVLNLDGDQEETVPEIADGAATTPGANGASMHDWVMSLEVAEHLPTRHEDAYIDNLHRLNRRGIVMSWATPGQGGLGHFNERSNDYVEGRMRSLGYARSAAEEQELRGRSSLSWFINTVMVFRRRKMHEPAS